MKVIIQRPLEDSQAQAFVNQVFEVELRPLQKNQNFYVLENFSYCHEHPDPELPYLHKGYYDSHLHLIGMGLVEKELDLRPMHSFRELIFLLETASRDAQVWVKGYGWDQTSWGLSEAQVIQEFQEKAPEDIPLFLLRVCGHSALVNRAFKEFIGKPQLNTWIGDQELAELQDLLPHPTALEMLDAFKRAQRKLLASGVTGVSDMSLSDALVDTLKQAADAGELLIDVEGVFLDTPKISKHLEHGPWLQKNNIAIGPLDREAIFTLRYWKRYLDGSLGSRTAWLESSYQDAETVGQQLYETKELVRAADHALRLGLGLSFHCIGDAALSQAIEVGDQLKSRMQEALGGMHGFALPIKKHRLEHCQVIQEKHLKKLREQGFWQLFLQPHHRIADQGFIEARLGTARLLKNAYRGSSILKHGLAIGLSSDAPIDDFSPEVVLRAAMTHPNPDERLSFDEALWWYSSGARLAAGLAPGLLQKGATVFLTQPIFV